MSDRFDDDRVDERASLEDDGCLRETRKSPSGLRFGLAEPGRDARSTGELHERRNCLEREKRRRDAREEDAPRSRAVPRGTCGPGLEHGRGQDDHRHEKHRDAQRVRGAARIREDAREKAAALVTSFTDYLQEHRDDIRALDILYSRPYKERLTFTEIKELATAIERPPRQWTPEKLWRAYELLDQSKVRGSGGRMLTDIVSLVRFALQQDDELVPFREQVEARFASWLAVQEQQGTSFTPEQTQWLTWMKESVASDMGIAAESFEYTPFVEHGGIGKAVQVFGERLPPLLEELTGVLAA